MAIETYEIADARRVTQGKSAETALIVRGTDDEAAALAAVASDAPESLDGIPILTIGPISSIGDPTITLTWRCDVSYALAGSSDGTPPPRAVGGCTLSFDAAAQPRREFRALTHIGESEGGFDYKGAVNVTDEAVEGVDVDEWAVAIEAVKVFDPKDLPSLAAIVALSGDSGRTPVNDDAITLTDTETGVSLTLAKGELRLRGVRMGRARSDGMVELAYSFLAAPNRTNVTIPNVSDTIDAVAGHELIWCRYREGWNVELSQRLRRPVSWHLERMYPEADFSCLGL